MKWIKIMTKIRNMIGVVYQESILDDLLTVRENIKY